MKEINNDLPKKDLREKHGVYDPKLDFPGYKNPHSDLLPESLSPLITKILHEYPKYTMPLLLNGHDEVIIRDLYNFPNVLLAGTIASGKTQFIYNNITLWLYNFHPAEFKLLIGRSKPIDYNAFAVLESHFSRDFSGVNKFINEPPQIRSVFDSLINELDSRLHLFHKADVKTILDYNTLFKQRKLNPDEGHRHLPNIVFILDDLQTFLNKETTDSLIYLTQRNLYTGIYVLAATSQIMSRDITTQLKANFSIRIAMKLMSQNESRRILDRVGAEKLKPGGELLYEQGTQLMKGKHFLIENALIQTICKYIGDQEGYPTVPTSSQTDAAEWNDVDLGERDKLFEEAARLVVSHQLGSTSLIQRRLKLGYNRAGRIIDQLEAAGIVGPFEGSKAREVLYPDEYSLEQYLKTLNDSTYKSYTPPSPKQEVKRAKPTNASKAKKRSSPSKQSHKSTTLKSHTFERSSNTFKTGRSSPTLQRSSPRLPPPKKNKANILIWILIVIIALIAYFIIDWDSFLK